MKVLVTGVKGQLGFDVVKELKKRGYDAVALILMKWILLMLRKLLK